MTKPKTTRVTALTRVLLEDQSALPEGGVADLRVAEAEVLIALGAVAPGGDAPAEAEPLIPAEDAAAP